MLEAMTSLMRDVGTALKGWASGGGVDGHWEGSQYHAKADRWAHEMICAGLAKLPDRFPVLSEEAESGEFDLARGPCWLIDPIDGTASYTEGFPGYVTQIALMENGRPVLAVVYAPATDEMFVAKRGAGAFKNGNRLPAKTSSHLTLIDNYPEPRGVAAAIYRDLAFAEYLESGSLGLKICRVAEGACDAFVKDIRVRDWDVAAPELILSEVIGRLTDRFGQRLTYTGNGAHEGLVAARDLLLGDRICAYLAKNSQTTKRD